MENTFEQSEQWQPLVKLLKLGKANPAFQPILWVGAGLSVMAGYPTTAQLIAQLEDLSLTSLPDFDPTDPTLDPNSAQASFTHWVQNFAEQNGYGHLARTLSHIFSQYTQGPTELHKKLVALPLKTCLPPIMIPCLNTL